MAEPSLDHDEAQSCGALEALERQEPFVNQATAESNITAFVSCAGEPRSAAHDQPRALAENATARPTPYAVSSFMRSKTARIF